MKQATIIILNPESANTKPKISNFIAKTLKDTNILLEVDKFHFLSRPRIKVLKPGNLNDLNEEIAKDLTTIEQFEMMELKGTYLQSFKKFLQVNGHLSAYKSTTMSPKLVTISTDIFSFSLCQSVFGC